MTPTIQAYLLRYGDDGEFCADPMTIEGQMVVDERYGVVLEILLPPSVNQHGERVVQGHAELQSRSEWLRCRDAC